MSVETGDPDHSTASPSIVFLLDVDNTLLDNDRLKTDISTRLLAMLGRERSERFWQIYEDVRKVEDFVDYPATITRWTEEFNDPDTGRALESLLDDLNFRSYVYPDIFETLNHLRTIGKAVILSDGDQVFQPLKIRNSGLGEAVDGVLIYVHKELELPKVFVTFAADHYVMVDDKPRILAALEAVCPTTFTTVMVLQGKYAIEGRFEPEPDYVVEHTADLRSFDRAAFLDGR